MSSLLSHLITSTTLLTLSLYHLTTTITTYLKSPTTFSSKPYHPLPFTSHRHLRHLPLYILTLFLTLSTLFSLISSSTPDPLFPLHHLSLLLSSSLSLLFLLISLSLLSPLLPHDVTFALFSAAFALLSLSSSSTSALLPSGIESHCSLVSSRISRLSSLLCLALAVNPKLFVADVGLSASVALQGLWALQTGLVLHVDAFVPSGCHRMLDVASGVEGSTKCDLDESKIRAAAVLDLAFVVHVIVVVVVILVVYGVVAKVVGSGSGSGGMARRSGSYEALPNTENAVVQMKTLTGTQA